MRPILLVLTFTLLAGPAAAASIGIYFDSEGQSQTLQVPALETARFYVVAGPFTEPVWGTEFGVELPPEIVVLSRTLPSAIDLPLLQWDNLVYLFYGCMVVDSYVLMSVSFMLLDPADDLLLRLTPPAVSSFDPPAPGILYCDHSVEVLEPVPGPLDAPPGSAIVNPAGVPVPEGSWGAVKALY